jgi:hypothetical protein
MWKDKTCEDCEYRKRNRCFFNPPTYNNGFTTSPNVLLKQGRRIHEDDIFREACAQWKEREDV